MGDQKRAQPDREVKSRWAASTDAADAIHVEDQQGATAAKAASSHQRKSPKAAKPIPKAPDSAELKDTAEQQTMQLLNAELVDVARELYKFEPQMMEESNQIISLRSDISQDHLQEDKDKALEADEVASNTESDEDKRNHRKLQNRLKSDERSKGDDMSLSQVAAKGNVESSLKPAYSQFQAIVAKATGHGLHGHGLERGTSYLRGVLERYSTLTLWMNVDVPLLAQMKSELQVFTNHLNIQPVKDLKIDKLHTVDDAHANHDKAFLALGAAEAQMDFAKSASDPHELANAIALVQSHIADAIPLAKELEPNTRSTLKGQYHSLIAEGKDVDHVALSHQLNTPSVEAMAVTLMHSLSK